MAAAYGATKAGLINMAEALRFDAERMGIKLQIINPGFVETPATDENPFEMPFLLKVDDAARRLADGLESDAFEVTFPKRFTYQLKLLRMLPFDVYHWIVSRATGWKGKPLDNDQKQDAALACMFVYHLPHIDVAGFEAGFTIMQVVAP
jgi:NAD(P)-dependent dehydrogenase (short-subunit alcohol dehydrogenase family)